MPRAPIRAPKWLAAAALPLLVAAACSSASDTGAVGSPEAAPDPPTVVAPTATAAASSTAVPTPAASAAAPTATVEPTTSAPTPTAEPGPASQSPVDAARDEIVPLVAELTFNQRVDIQGEVQVGGQRWVISRIPSATLDELGRSSFVDAGIDTSSGELLHLDGDRIRRAVSMPSAPPTWIIGDGNLVFAGRQGDGAYPSSSIVRVDVATGDVTRLWLPASYANRGWPGDGVWTFVDPDSKAMIWPVLTAAIEAQAATDPGVVAVAVEDLDAAVDQVQTHDPGLLPLLALTNHQCGLREYSGLVFDFGSRCVAQQPDRGSDPVVLVGDELVPGRLVGAGRLEAGGPLLAAIVALEEPETARRPLVFVELDQPGTRIESEVVGSDEGSTLQHVSFFDGGFVGTWAVDQSTKVEAFDTESQPVVGFVSPTDRDLGYPPDPAITFAVMTVDGEQLAFVERSWPRDGSFKPGTATHLVQNDPTTGTELNRVSFELPTSDYVVGMDFDGRWALISVMRYGEAEPGTPPPLPFIIDSENGDIYPLGIDSLGVTTFERSDLAGR